MSKWFIACRATRRNETFRATSTSNMAQHQTRIAIESQERVRERKATSQGRVRSIRHVGITIMLVAGNDVDSVVYSGLSVAKRPVMSSRPRPPLVIIPRRCSRADAGTRSLQEVFMTSFQTGRYLRRSVAILMTSSRGIECSLLSGQADRRSRSWYFYIVTMLASLPRWP